MLFPNSNHHIDLNRVQSAGFNLTNGSNRGGFTGNLSSSAGLKKPCGKRISFSDANLNEKLVFEIILFSSTSHSPLSFFFFLLLTLPFPSPPPPPTFLTTLLSSSHLPFTFPFTLLTLSFLNSFFFEKKEKLR